jgi:hypothetical protein
VNSRHARVWCVAVATTAAVVSACGGSAGSTSSGNGGDSTNFSKNSLFPAHLGDYWEYKITGGAGTQTLDDKLTVTGESAIADGKAVTFHSVVTMPAQPAITTDLHYQFLNGGSVKFDFASLSSTSVTGTGTTAVIPSAADILSGTSKPFTSTATLTRPNSASIQTSVSGTSQGTGSESVTEVGRSLKARTVKIDLNLTESIGSGSPIHLSFTLKLWLVSNIGVVKESLSDQSGTVDAVVDLVATNLS